MNRRNNNLDEDKRTPLPTDAPFDCLGHDHGTFFFRPHATDQIRGLTADQFKVCFFLELAPLVWWSKHFPTKQSNCGFDWDEAFYRAADSLISACYKKGCRS